MAAKYEMVIFDVDGTLLNTTEGIEAAVQYTIKVSGLPKLPQEQIRTFIGPPIQDSFSRAYKITDKERLQELATVFRNRYKDFELLKAKPYDGIYEVCERLSESGVRMAVATYKREDYAISIMKHFGFDRYMESIYGGDHENKLKKADIIQKCLRGSRAAVMIGDTMHDAAGAREADIDFIGVTYGFGFREKGEIERLQCAGAAAAPVELLDMIL